MKPVILIHGKPGLGKSTLARGVAAALQSQGIRAAHFSIGNQLRAISSGEIESRYAAALRAEHAILYRHAHVTDPALIHGVVGEFLSSTVGEAAVIDGHPRYMEMTAEYERTLQMHGWYTKLVVIIDGDDTLALERMAARNRNEHGMQEDPAWRLADYQSTMASVLTWLAMQYSTIHVDAHHELEEKISQVCQALAEA